ncbi:amylo-alpha [Cystoisospora suis]|uniref:Amylo-alpha n=1 Tax=Cystoisospora suis TaxID=483139 RepID=A0A2C6L0G4_9APIC|nr:amylo-alpha [Cystoisospora suis]
MAPLFPPANPKRLPHPGPQGLDEGLTPCMDVYTSHFDKDGVLEKPECAQGNFRIPKGVTLELVSLNGSQAEPVVGCMAETPLGDELQIPSQVDDLGNLTFTFVVDLAGPYRIHLQYGSCDGRDEDLGEGAGGHTTSSSTSPTPSTPEEKKNAASTTAPSGGKGFGWFASLNVSSKTSTPPPAPSDEKNTTGASQKDEAEKEKKTQSCDKGASPPRVARLSPASIVIVEPAMTINGVPLKQESISIQTVLSRCLGSFSRWKRMFTNTAELGYNMIHFTPLQALGESGSCYSIADQLHISDFFLDETLAARALSSDRQSTLTIDGGGGTGGGLGGPLTNLRRANSSEIVGFEELKAIINMLETELGLLSTIDLVLNHTASNSPWLRDHPDSGYNTDVCPWLRGPYELDWRLQEFSQRVVKGEFTDKYQATKYIDNEGQLQNVLRAFDEELLKPFRMEEWFQMHIDKTVEGWMKALKEEEEKGEEEKKRKNDEVQQGLDDGLLQDKVFQEALTYVGVERGPSIVISPEFLLALFPHEHDKDRLYRILHQVAGRLNDKANESRDFVRRAVEGHARWERLECRRGPLGMKHWEALAPRYFTPLNEQEPDPTKRTVVANNGWVMGWDATKDFAAAGSLVYLRRELVVWSDCVKLRYGSGPSDSPFLWNHMTEYCRLAAKAFHGVRLDNCHSTPIHVAQHMLRECRRIRPDFWIFAELFTGSQALDLHFERCLGINALVREAMQTHNAGDLAYHLKKFGMQHGLGELSPVYSSFHCSKTGGGLGLLGSLTATSCQQKTSMKEKHEKKDEHLSAGLLPQELIDDFKQKSKASFSFQSLPSSSSVVQDSLTNKFKVKREDSHMQNGGDTDYEPTDIDHPHHKSDEENEEAGREEQQKGGGGGMTNGYNQFQSPLMSSTPRTATSGTPRRDIGGGGSGGGGGKKDERLGDLHTSSVHSIASRGGGMGIPLRTALCPALFYDCTHDNETPTQKFTPGAALPLSVLLAAAGCAVGSTRGFDEIVPRTLSVVGEDRLYEDFHPEIPLINPVQLLGGGAGAKKSNGLSKKGEGAAGNTTTATTAVAHSGATGETPIVEEDGEEEGSSYFDGGAPQKSKLTKDPILDEIVVKWNHGGNHVSIKGDWDGWAHDIYPEKQENGVFEFHIKKGVHYAKDGNPPGVQTLHFKFIVDGNWNVNSDLPCEKDGWNVNNVVCTDGSSPDSSSSWKKDGTLPGILRVRPVINALHVRAGQEGFTQLSAECKTDDLVVAVRHHPTTHECIYFIARCAYQWQQGDSPLPEIQLSGKIKEVPLMASLFIPGDANSHFQPALGKINGLPGCVKVYNDLNYFAPNTYFDPFAQTTTLRLQNFPRGSVLVVCTAPETYFGVNGKPGMLAATHRQLREHFSPDRRRISELLQEVSLSVLSEVLFSCEPEERDRGRGPYNIWGYGNLVYAGLTGPIALFDQIRHLSYEQQVSHPIYQNLMQGYWLLRYHVDRLTHPTLQPLKKWLSEGIDIIETHCPVYTWLRPYYADQILSSLYAACCRLILGKMPISEVIKPGYHIDKWTTRTTTASSSSSSKSKTSEGEDEMEKEGHGKHGCYVSPGDLLLAQLSVASLQFYSYVPSSPLVWGTQQPSLSAGLPHFSTGFMRAWGRDTFIALRGLLLTTGRWAEAKAEILGFANVMRHGLIPNLLDSGNNPRYNARDATWFFCQAIQDYCLSAPKGLELLKEPVKMKYEGHATQVPEMPIENLGDVLHHICLSHAKGIEFREWNAGHQIDEHMRDEGFNIRITMDPNTGLIFGGNRFNCGTWMDKNGSSDKVGTQSRSASYAS